MKKRLLAIAAWYFLVMNNGIGPSKIGPFTSQLKCDTYRMRVAHTRGTSNCIQLQPPKKK